MKSNKLKNLIAGMSLALGITLINPAGASASWKQDSNGWWNTEGSTYSTGWKNINNIWYNFGTDGYMKTGWINDNGTWYYLDNSGAMKTGWVNPGNTWYYLDQSGAMKTGWINTNNAWYFTDSNGAMKTGFLTLNDKTYYLNESGSMVTGDITLNGVKYSFAQSGEKISQSTTQTESATNNSVTESADKDSTSTGGSGSSGGGSGSSSGSSSSTSKFEGYSDLYGTWKVDSKIENSGMSNNLSGLIANSAIGENFTVNNTGITSDLLTSSNVTSSEKVLTNSEFKNKYGTNISKLGLSGNEVNCITVTSGNKQADIIVSKDNKVVAIADQTAFNITKQ